MPSQPESRLNLTEVDGYLIVNLPSVISDGVIHSHKQQITELVEKSRYRGVILNIAAVSLLDYSTLQKFRKICQLNTLLGSQTVLMGANASIAAYLASMPEGFDDLTFCQDMESARQACG